MNSIAILFALNIINDQPLIDALIKTEKDGRCWLTGQLKQAGYKYFSMEGNYVLFYPKKASGEIVDELKKRGIWVRDYGRGILKGWIRVSTGSVRCMERFWNEFKDLDF